MKMIDARGKNCPIPVVLAQKAIAAGETAFTVRVDNAAAVKNLKRLAESRGYQAHPVGDGEGFAVTFAASGTPTAQAASPSQHAAAGDWTVFAGRDCIGDGDRELGSSLMRMFFYTLTQGDELPGTILFMNAGVKLPTLDAQVAEHLNALQERGVKVLVCGTCLNFYGLADQLKAGTVSNMYDIVSCMARSAKVVTL